MPGNLSEGLNDLIFTPKKKNYSGLWILLFLVLLGGVFTYFKLQTPDVATINNKQSAPSISQNQIDLNDPNQLVAVVGRIIDLPKDEQPAVATVTDLEKAKEKEFFKNALVGDKVLVYKLNKKAYLYRPSENRVVEVGTVN